MTYAEMLQADFELRDDLAEVTLTNAVTGTIVRHIKAKKRNLNFRETMLGGSLGLEPTDQVFMLGVGRLNGATPNRGDKITMADGTTWTLISNILSPFGDTAVYYDVIARQQL